jgi:glucokinase
MRKFTIILFRDETEKEDDYLGSVGTDGSTWKSAPSSMERLNVVSKSDYDELVEAMTNLLTHPENGQIRHECYAILAKINGESNGH